MVSAIGLPGECLCTACFDGVYLDDHENARTGDCVLGGTGKIFE
jgi:hypothetical protein